MYLDHRKFKNYLFDDVPMPDFLLDIIEDILDDGTIF
jgi:hypothetical protein